MTRAGGAPERKDSLAALRLAPVRRYAVGKLLATFAAQMQAVAIGWQLYERTGSAWALGFTGLVQVVPALLLALPAGAVADRRDRRRVTLAAQLVLTAAALGLALASWFAAPVWVLYVLLFVSGVGVAFSAPAGGALLAQLVPPEHFADTNAWLTSSRQLAAMAGPAFAGALIASTGSATPVFALQAVCAFAFVVALAGIPSIRAAEARLEPAAPHEAASLRDLFAGFRFVWRTEVFLAAITLDLFAVLLGGATALLPIYAKDILHEGPSGLGLLRAAPSLGAFAMAVATTRLPPWKKPGAVLLWVVAGFGLATVGFGLSTSFPLSLAMLFLTGVFDNVSVVIRLTLEQLLTPDEMRGRVGAIHWVFIGLSNEMGAFESGATAALFGPVGSVVGGGIGTLLVVGLVCARWRGLSRLRPFAELAPGGG
ncbi:MAG: MFS transporter [Myxococcales bacterium]